MISTKIRVSPSLLKKLSRNVGEECIEDLVDKIGVDSLENVKEFGLGVGSVAEPYGGAPHWQGKIYVEGHYRGYLSDTHYMKHEDPYHVQIVSSAEFVDGVLQGYSTNWHGVVFGANNYPKRAVDKLIAEGSIPIRWKGVTKGRLR